MRTLGKLTALRVSKTRKAGYVSDGGGLWLQVSRTGTKSWVFRYARHGRQHEAGLGPVHTVSLVDARERATRCRKWLLDHHDPIQMLRAERSKAALAAAAVKTFDECATAYIEAHRPSWKNPKHAGQWQATLSTYASPIMGSLPVSDVTTALVMRILEPIWTTKPETAGRVRGRIERILDWAAVHGYRKGDNPARWRGHLDKLLPTLSKRARVRHHPALPYQEIGGFMQDLRKQPGMAARALELAILTACRTNEVIAAHWAEIDFENALWTIPANRMKSKREHRVPLAPTAMELLKELPRMQDNDFIFPGSKHGSHMSNMAMLAVLKRMERSDLTVHGFRSTFRDWAAETTNYPREVCEMALAHTVSNQVEAAYRRGDLFQKRQQMMNVWSQFAYAN